MTAYPLPSIQNYENFDLLIDPTVDGYQARVINSPVGQAITQFNLDVRISDQGDPKQVGALLYQTVFSGNVGICLRRSLDAVAQQPNNGLRIRLRLTTVPKLATLPWEMLYDAERNLFFALSAQTPLVRYQELDQRELPLQAALPLRLLVLISDPVDFWPRLDGEHEWQQLYGAMADLVARGKVQIERLPARLDLLQQRMQQSPVHLLHFIGHGWYDNADRNGLMMETENGQADRVAVERLTALLHDHAALRLVFLNACEGARGDHTNAFAGVAQRLVQQGIPAVIAMQKEVSDQSAIALTQTFYQALAAGSPVDAALAEARKAIFAISNNHEWNTPALFSRAVNNQLFDLLDVLPQPPCPYPGMVPFAKADARFFFGREDEIAELRHRLRHHNQLFVIGPSGSGKSSLVFAGLLPELEKQNTTPWHIRTFRPGATPLAALNEALADRSVVAEATTTASTGDQKFLLVIDQFEELFVQASKADQTTFIARVKALYQEQQVKLLITMRADFYPDLMNSDLWPIDVSQRLEIAPLRGEKLRQAIEQPAANVGVQLEAGLLERLLADAADEPGVLPLLQETMVLLWEEQERRVLPLVAYTRLGKNGRSGLVVAMATKADATLASLKPEQQRIARRIFLRLVQFGEGRPDTRRQQGLIDLRSVTGDTDLFDATLQQLANHRLLTLTSDSQDAERKVDIAHEMLIVGWPAAQAWVQARREAELMRRRLETKAIEWMRLGRASGGMLDIDELSEAERWLVGSDAEELGYSEALLTLVQQSRIAIDAAIAEKAKQQRALAAETARAEEQKKTSSRLRRFTFVLAVLAFAALLAGSLAWMQRQEANRNASAAATAEAKARSAQQETERLNQTLRAQQLARNAQLLHINTSLDHATSAALLLGIEAMRVISPPLPSTLTTLLDLLNRTGGIGLGGHAGRVTEVAFTPDGQWVATGGEDGAVQMWRVTDPTRQALVFRDHRSAITALAFSSDSQILATASDDAVVLQKIDDNHFAPVTLTGFQSYATSITFSPDNHWFALINDKNVAYLWPVDNLLADPIILPGVEDNVIVGVLAFSPDSHWLATGSGETILLWSVDNPGATPITLAGHTSQVTDAAFSPDGQWLATSGSVYFGGDVAFRLWKTSDFEATPISFVHPSGVEAFAFSLDGRRLATSGGDNIIRIWSIAQPSLAPILLVGHRELIRDLAFSPDGEWLVSGSFDQTARIWFVNVPAQPSITLLDAFGPIAISQDNKHIVTASSGDTARLWSIDHLNQQPVILPGHEYVPQTLVFSHDGQWLASASEDGVHKDHSARLWRMGNANHDSIFLSGHVGDIESVAFSHDDRWLATASDKVRLWQLDQPNRELIVLPGASSNSVAFSVNDKWLATAGATKEDRLLLWNFTDLSAPPIELKGNKQSITALTFSHDGQWLATAGYHDMVDLYKLDDLDAEPTKLPVDEDGTYALAFSPDGRWLATLGVSLRLWQTAMLSTPPLVFEGHEPVATAVIFSPDSHWFFSTGWDGIIRLWRVRDHSVELVNLKGNNGFSDAAFSNSVAAFSPNSQWFASLNDDMVKLWRLDKPDDEPILLPGGGKTFRAVAFSPDGQWLAIADDDNTIQLWQYQGNHLVTLACTVTGRNLNKAEWEEYFPGEAYRQTCLHLPVHSSISVVAGG